MYIVSKKKGFDLSNYMSAKDLENSFDLKVFNNLVRGAVAIASDWFSDGEKKFCWHKETNISCYNSLTDIITSFSSNISLVLFFKEDTFLCHESSCRDSTCGFDGILNPSYYCKDGDIYIKKGMPICIYDIMGGRNENTVESIEGLTIELYPYYGKSVDYLWKPTIVDGFIADDLYSCSGNDVPFSTEYW